VVAGLLRSTSDADEEPQTMATVFTRIIDGDLPGRFVWRDADVVAFLSIGPITPGHTLVVPRAEVDHWLDLEPALWRQCTEVAREIGLAIQRAYDPPRVAEIIAGFEVPHCHIHVLQAHTMSDLDFTRADPDPDPAGLDDAAERIRTALRELGHGDRVDAG
jgi:diadenosine tetraphosphate (Ap4A) HIT family hydrolase